MKKTNEWIKIDPQKLPSDRLICEWKHPDYGIIQGSLIWSGGKLLSEQSWWVLPCDSRSAEIALCEFTHWRRIWKPEKTIPMTPKNVMEGQLSRRNDEDNQLAILKTANCPINYQPVNSVDVALNSKAIDDRNIFQQRWDAHKFWQAQQQAEREAEIVEFKGGAFISDKALQGVIENTVQKTLEYVAENAIIVTVDVYGAPVKSVDSEYILAMKNKILEQLKNEKGK